MNKNSPANVSGLGYVLANDLWDRRNGVDVGIRRDRLAAAFQVQLTHYEYDTSGNSPGYTLWVSPELALVIVRGTRTAEQALRQGRDWGNLELGVGQGLNATTAAQVADRIWQEGTIRGLSRSSRVIMFGHSYGGEIATALYGIHNTGMQDPRPTVITIGSPRVVQALGQCFYTNVDMRRYNFVNDPFPRLPFQGQDGLFTQFLAAGGSVGNWATWRHVGNGCSLYENGILDYEYLPRWSGSYPQLSLIGLLTDDGGPALIAHSPDTYRDALFIQATRDGSLVYEPTGATAPQSPPPPSPAPIPSTPSQREAAFGVIENQRAAAFLGIGTETPFKYMKVGSLHCMASDGIVILASRHRKTAQSNCKFWNQVWKKWNSADFGGMPALLGAIQKNFIS